MPQPAPDPCELREELSIRDLLPISLVVREGNSDCAKGGVPRAEVGQDGAALAGRGMSIKIATREAASPELLGDAPEFADEHFGRQRVNASPFECEPRAIHLHALFMPYNYM